MDSLLRNEDLFAAAGRNGHRHPGYAEAFVEAIEVRHLRRSGSFLLTRAGRGLRWLDLGTVDADPGFKDGWTEDVRPSYRCGRVIDRVACDELVAAAGIEDGLSFPAYRPAAARLRP